MPEVGLEGQEKLKASKVLIVGAGGLGTPSATYLAAAGVGTIGIVDYDIVERSNLHRQVLYSERDVGMPKVDVIKSKLREVNPNVEIQAFKLKLDSSNAMEILRGYDVVVDGTDNFPVRYLINDACVFLGKPNVYASIYRFDGQASVFHAPKGPCYRCLFPSPPPPDWVPTCAEGGVLGVLPGVMGGIQAVQVINTILGNGKQLVGRLLLFNALEMTFDQVEVKKNPDCLACGVNPKVTELIDYEEFCGIRGGGLSQGYQLSPKELKSWMDEGKHFVLVDVREPTEYRICHIAGSKLIPMGQLQEKMTELKRDEDIVVCCHVGVRSARAVSLLRSVGFKNAYNLEGGVTEWAKQVEPSMPVY
jgi:sulfur-carrier protein adenylyltransferase/sulfurtransferase